MADSPKKPIKIYGNDSLSTRVTLFQKRATETKEKQRAKSFSESDSLVFHQVLDKNDPRVEEMKDNPKKPIKIYGNDALSTRVAAFQKKATEHKEKQKANPFSASHAPVYRQVLDKNDPRYGRPPEGSKTEMRGLQAGKHISGEVQLLCDMIYQYGHLLPDGRVIIPFGELFEMYTRISNKVVGILLRARKHGFVDFEGEMLFQRRDDHVLITLTYPIEELHEIFGIKGPPPKRMVDEEEENDEMPM